MQANETLNPRERILFEWAFLIAIGFLLLVAALSATAEQVPQKTFASAWEASHALYQAVQNSDGQAVMAILGVGPELVSSGDDAIDRLQHVRFVQKYEQMHRLVREQDGDTVLYIGAENWPFPFPLVATNGKWRFDSVAGAQEIAARRIGENESMAIQVCQDLATAVQPVSGKETGDPALQLARKLASGGAGVAKLEPFHGYNFRIGSEQSVGVALVAYPAQYGVSGVMTFIVLPGGSVYEKDLGSETATVAPQIDGKPDGQWAVVQ